MQTYTMLTMIAISYLSMGYFEVRNISCLWRKRLLREVIVLIEENPVVC